MSKETLDNGELLQTFRNSLNNMFTELYSSVSSVNGSDLFKTSIISNKTSTGVGPNVVIPRYKLPVSIIATITGAASVSSTVELWGYNNDNGNTQLMKFKLSGVTSVTDSSVYLETAWNYVWANVSTTDGGAAVSMTTGY